jgi:hypothetical protein
MGMAILRAAWVEWATWGCKPRAYFNICLNEEAWQKCWAFLLWGLNASAQWRAGSVTTSTNPLAIAKSFGFFVYSSRPCAAAASNGSDTNEASIRPVPPFRWRPP